MQKKRRLPQMLHQSMSSLLLPDYRRRILGLLLLHPDEALHGREIARRTGLQPGSVARELVRLTQAGLLHRARRGNQQVYRADKESPIYTELTSILRKTSGLVELLADALAPIASRLRVAFVFGSTARAAETAGSDIDLLLIGDAAFREVVELLFPAQSMLGREVNPRIFSVAEFSARLPVEPFLADVVSKPKLFVIGNAHELEELARHQP
jgi:DNA-binding transcriptional ArsR family regulator